MARRRQRFIDRRRVVGLSQEQLADVLGVERKAVGRWERVESHPQPVHRPRLADALRVSIEDLEELLQDIVDARDRDEITVVVEAAALNQSEFAAALEWPAWFGGRTAHLIGTVDTWPSSAAQPGALQDLLDREFLMFDAVVEGDDPGHAVSRRQALITIAALPIALVPLDSPEPATGAAVEFFLSHCAASLTACWHLLRGRDLHTIDHAVSSYLVRLEAVAKGVARWRDSAARLASQAHRICGIIALHRDQLRMREYHCQQALHYAGATSDISTRVAALISLASTYFYDADPARAAGIYEQALPFEAGIPPLQRSRIHAELSVVYGQLGRESAALRSAELAEDLYPQHPEQDPSHLYAEFTRASLTLERGLSYLALADRFPNRDHHRDAASVLSWADRDRNGSVPDRIRFEIVNHQARAAVLLNDLDAFETYVSRAADGVTLLGSRQRQKEIQDVWRRAAVVWPDERRLKALRGELPPAIAR
jgi:transcriptional regulator with XRE-family HTH domain